MGAGGMAPNISLDAHAAYLTTDLSSLRLFSLRMRARRSGAYSCDATPHATPQKLHGVAALEQRSARRATCITIAAAAFTRVTVSCFERGRRNNTLSKVSSCFASQRTLECAHKFAQAQQHFV
mmetsp:Transcript_15499/g.43394  ORF Transcript_15499/g.43394 Transcript_15499/m.43394 type:complete len:123 (+) Transcript_15499:609-977(+)